MTDTNDELAKRAQALLKRYAMAHKASLAKVAHHLGMAKAAHAKGMGCLTKAMGHMVEMDKAKKAADPGTMAGHMSAAHDAFNTAGDHMDDMEAHLGKAMSAWGTDTAVSDRTDPGGAIIIPGLTELTEGEVPWYDSAAPYGEKLAKAVTDGLIVTKQAADKMVADAVTAATAKATSDGLQKQIELLQKQVDTLQKMPGPSKNIRVFDFNKSPLPGINLGEDENNRGTKLAKILDGVDMNIEDEGGFTKAAGTMIANMIKNGPKFGKTEFGKPPMYDPSFHGRGGTGARN